jgi:hypothetical protein
MKFIKVFEEFTEDISIQQSEYNNAIKSLIGNEVEVISESDINELKSSIGDRYNIEEQNYTILNPGSVHSIPMLNITSKDSGRKEYLSSINIIYNKFFYVKVIIRSGNSKFYKFSKWGDVIKLVK